MIFVKVMHMARDQLKCRGDVGLKEFNEMIKKTLAL